MNCRLLSVLISCTLWAEPSLAAPRLIFPLTVSWEILRSGFGSNMDVALEADYFGEEWKLIYAESGKVRLITPHGQAEALAIKGSDGDTPFDMLAISELEFAKILGVQSDAVDPAINHVFVDFSDEGRGEQFFAFKANPKFYLNVTFRLQIGPNLSQGESR